MPSQYSTAFDRQFVEQANLYFGNPLALAGLGLPKDWRWFKAQAIAESGLNAKAVSPAGAKGGDAADAGGIHLVDQLGSHFSSGNIVVNNTLDEPVIACVRINESSTNNVVFNNICIGSTGIVFEGTGNYQSNNYSSATGGASIFTSYSGHNYTLLSTSPAKDFGIASYQSKSAPATDYLGNVRLSGGGYDAGAYEYQDVLPSEGPTWLTSSGIVIVDPSTGAAIGPPQ